MLLNKDMMGGLGAALTAAAREPIEKLFVGAADPQLSRGAGATVSIVDLMTPCKPELESACTSSKFHAQFCYTGQLS